MTSDEAHALERLTQWAVGYDQVRALILESSRAIENAPIDALSDYDVLLVVSDLRPFIEDDTWLSAFGTPLVTLSDPLKEWDADSYIRMVLYMDHTKIDYILCPVAVARQIAESQKLPEFLDWGYRALLDKDDLTTGWPAPTRTAYLPARPTEREYLALVEEFWWESTYVAKNLWRDELYFASYNLDVVMRYELLLRLLEWRVEIDHGWAWKPGVLGRGLKRQLPPETWAELAATWRGPELAANWEALFAMTALFGRVAREVGAALGYTYPETLDQRVSAYLREVQRMPH
ncbi:MAG TPA: aminoglycoside 6-adenylyltransferase [Ktedonobacterales bacterium]|nr:aminoglycoside 6-adenylyltransferase [Ktedonobacterales bacterium]